MVLPPLARAQVVISEIMYDPIGGNTNEFIELHNVGASAAALGGWFFSDGVTYTFANPTTLATGAYLVVAVNRAAFAARYPAVSNLAAGAYGGQLSNQGEKLALSDAASNVVFAVTYNNKAPWPTAAAGLGSSLVLVDPLALADSASNWVASAQLHGSPGGPDIFFVRDVVINEILAHTDPPQEDAIELGNLTTNAVCVGGWYLSDDNAVRKKYRFPAGCTIPPQGYLVVYQQQLMTNLLQTATNALIPFALSSKGDELYLSEANAAGEIVRYVDQFAYDASANGSSFGRYPDGTGEFVTLATPTFGIDDPVNVEQFRTGTGARNAGPRVGPVVINEIMYHPSVTNDSGHMSAEYVEILNISDAAVPLYNEAYPAFTWSLTGGIRFDFPANLTLLPGQFLLVVGTNDVAGFRQSYGLAESLIILGPFSNNLDNAGDTVRLRAPNSPEPPDNVAARYVVDEVSYNDQLPWPLAADGLGGSLERNVATAYGNSGDNWHSLPGVCTPGASNSIAVPPGSVVISEFMANNQRTLRDEDGDSSDWIELYNTRNYDIPLTGWHLTDNPGNLTRWTFPALSIPAHGYVLVFASAKNRTNDVTKLHTNFGLDGTGEYLALVRHDLVIEDAYATGYPAQEADISYGRGTIGDSRAWPVQAGSTGRCLGTRVATPAADWTSRTFNDSSWRAATNGVGYDYDKATTAYRPLIATDVQDVMYHNRSLYDLFLRLPFVVSNAAGVSSMFLRAKFDDGFVAWLNGTRVASMNAPTTLVVNAVATAGHADTLAVEFETIDLRGQTHLLVEGTNVLALQGFNAAANFNDFLLLPELEIDRPQTDAATNRVGYLAAPSPANANGAALPGLTPRPTLSSPGGLYAGSLSVTIACASAQAQLHYTLDGTTPTTNSLLYTAPIAINGSVELQARAFESGLLPSPVAGAVYRTAFLGINEFLADNVRTTPDINDFGDFSDWIELYNDATNSVNLGGYYLSDNLNDPFRWRIPDGATIAPKGFFFVWADGFDSKPGLSLKRDFYPWAAYVTLDYHAPFKLGSEGDQIGLFTSGGNLVDGVTYGRQAADVSQGRFPDGSGTWRFFGEPTPAASNRAPALTQNIVFAPAVSFTPPGALITNTAPVSLVLTTATPVVAIRYTLDSSTPSSTSTLYAGSILLTTTTVVRARAFADGVPPGPVATHTFFVNERVPELPVLSIVTDPGLLYDSRRGIYTNNLKEREIPACLEYDAEPTNRAFRLNVGLRMFSLNSFLNAQKPFTVYLRSKYGADVLQYKLFKEKPVATFDRFVLRNGCDDWPLAYLRDPFLTELVRGHVDNALQGYQPVAAYLNGKYYGLLDIREKVDEMMFARNYGANIDTMDYFEMDDTGAAAEPLLDVGTADAYVSLTGFATTHNLSVPANFEQVQARVDLEDLSDFATTMAYGVERAWFQNRKWWHDRGPTGKWRWALYDNDRAFVAGYTSAATLADITNRFDLFRAVVTNPGFRQYFAQRTAAHLNTTFRAERVIGFLDQMAAQLRPEMAYHVAKWGAQGGIASTNAWEAELAVIRQFARDRPAIVFQQLAQLFGTNGLVNVKVSTGGGGGQVLANYCPLADGSTNTFVFGLPLQLKARPDIGQRFVRWEIIGQTTQVVTGAEMTVQPEGVGTGTVRAVFTPGDDHLLPAMVTNHLVLTAAESPYLATGDIIVPTNTSLVAGPGVTIRMPDDASIYVYGQLALLGSAAEPVCIVPNTNDNARQRLYVNPALTDAADLEPRWGGIAFDHADHTGVLSNVFIRGASLAQADPVNFKGAISALGSDLLIDGLDMDDVQFPIFVQEGASTVLINSRVHIGMTGDAINIKRAAYARAENNDFSGCGQPDTDAVDYDGVTGGIIRNNRIHDFTGSNSDGVDIGEAAKDLLIESNRISNCFDKGISIGQDSTVMARRNVISDVGMGFGIKDTGSYGLIENNTFVRVNHAVAVYEKSVGAGGGAATVRNCIISQAAVSPVSCDALSTLDVTYSLSDTDLIPGIGNGVGDPLFQHAATNFQLQVGSPAVDAGWPAAPLDSDGSRVDMGAMAFDWRAGHAVITEIHYHPADSNQAEFVELHNPGGAPLDLAGYRFARGISFVFPPGESLDPGAYRVIAASNQVSGCATVLVWTAGVLDNAGETIQLVDSASNEIDRVAYGVQAPWPLTPDGQGPSLSLVNPRANNAWAGNWCASIATGGTPGGPCDDPSALVTRKIVVTHGGHGSITPAGEVTVAVNSSPSFAILPDDWYHVLRVRLDGADVGTPTSCTFTNVTADHTLHADFAAALAASNTPKWWLAQWYPTNGLDAAATNDSDRDGMFTWAEYIAGTHPTNARSVWALRIGDTGGQMVVWCPTFATGTAYDGLNRYYALEYRTNLQVGGWLNVAGYTNILGLGQTLSFTNHSAGPTFYRANAALR